MDPYRTHEEPCEPYEEASWACSELAVAVMLAVIGGLGVAVGLVGHGTWELSVGSLLVLLGAKVFADERRVRSRPASRAR